MVERRTFTSKPTEFVLVRVTIPVKLRNWVRRPVVQFASKLDDPVWPEVLPEAV